MPKKIAAWLLLGLAIAGPVFPDDAALPPSPPDTLTLRQCLDLALANNPLIEAGKQSILSAEAKAGQALSLHFPRLGLEAGYTLLDADRVSQIRIPNGYYELFLGTSTFMNLKEAIERGDLASRGYPPGTDPYQVILNDQDTALPYYLEAMDQIPRTLESGYLAGHSIGATLSLVQPLFTGGKIKGRNLQAQWNRELEQAKQLEATQDLLAEVCRVYFGLSHGEQARQVGEEMQGRFEALLLITEGFVRDLGSDKNKYDYLTVKTYLQRIKALLADIRNQEAQGKLYLQYLADLPRTADVESNTRLPQAETVVVEEALSQLRQNNLVWRQLDLGRRIASQEVAIARAGFFPDLGLKGAYSLFHEEPQFGYVPESSWEATIGAQWEFPLGLQSVEAVKEKQAESRAVELKVDYAQRGMETRLAALLRDLAAGQEQVELLVAAAALAQERSQAAVLGYRVDMVGTDELIRSHVEESELRLQHLEAVRAQRQRWVEYYRLLGKDLHEIEL